MNSLNDALIATIRHTPHHQRSHLTSIGPRHSEHPPHQDLRAHVDVTIEVEVEVDGEELAFVCGGDVSVRDGLAVALVDVGS